MADSNHIPIISRIPAVFTIDAMLRGFKFLYTVRVKREQSFSGSVRSLVAGRYRVNLTRIAGVIKAECSCTSPRPCGHVFAVLLELDTSPTSDFAAPLVNRHGTIGFHYTPGGWKRIKQKTCDLCDASATWKHTEGGRRCDACNRP